jgi:hypothetical protein
VKFIALFLAIIVVTLTITPCCAFEGTESHADEIVQKEKHECSERSNDCCKDCSPFYGCGICIGFTFATQQAVNFNLPIKSVKHNTAYISVELNQIPLTIWQPPKLS